jgi:hypothetical protein
MVRSVNNSIGADSGGIREVVCRGISQTSDECVIGTTAVGSPTIKTKGGVVVAGGVI